MENDGPDIQQCAGYSCHKTLIVLKHSSKKHLNEKNNYRSINSFL